MNSKKLEQNEKTVDLLSRDQNPSRKSWLATGEHISQHPWSVNYGLAQNANRNKVFNANYTKVRFLENKVIRFNTFLAPAFDEETVNLDLAKEQTLNFVADLTRKANAFLLHAGVEPGYESAYITRRHLTLDRATEYAKEDLAKSNSKGKNKDKDKDKKPLSKSATPLIDERAHLLTRKYGERLYFADIDEGLDDYAWDRKASLTKDEAYRLAVNVMGQLPDMSRLAFRGAANLISFSSSALVDNKVKVHHYAINYKAYSSSDLRDREWSLAQVVDGAPKIDRSSFLPVQEHFVAAPTFLGGAIDPFAGVRVQLIKGGFAHIPSRDPIVEYAEKLQKDMNAAEGANRASKMKSNEQITDSNVESVVDTNDALSSTSEDEAIEFYKKASPGNRHDTLKRILYGFAWKGIGYDKMMAKTRLIKAFVDSMLETGEFDRGEKEYSSLARSASMNVREHMSKIMSKNRYLFESWKSSNDNDIVENIPINLLDSEKNAIDIGEGYIPNLPLSSRIVIFAPPGAGKSVAIDRLNVEALKGLRNPIIISIAPTISLAEIANYKHGGVLYTEKLNNFDQVKYYSTTIHSFTDRIYRKIRHRDIILNIDEVNKVHTELRSHTMHGNQYVARTALQALFNSAKYAFVATAKTTPDLMEWLRESCDEECKWNIHSFSRTQKANCFVSFDKKPIVNLAVKDAIDYIKNGTSGSKVPAIFSMERRDLESFAKLVEEETGEKRVVILDSNHKHNLARANELVEQGYILAMSPAVQEGVSIDSKSVGNYYMLVPESKGTHTVTDIDAIQASGRVRNPSNIYAYFAMQELSEGLSIRNRFINIVKDKNNNDTKLSESLSEIIGIDEHGNDYFKSENYVYDVARTEYWIRQASREVAANTIGHWQHYGATVRFISPNAGDDDEVGDKFNKAGKEAKNQYLEQVTSSKDYYPHEINSIKDEDTSPLDFSPKAIAITRTKTQMMFGDAKKEHVKIINNQDKLNYIFTLNRMDSVDFDGAKERILKEAVAVSRNLQLEYGTSAQQLADETKALTSLIGLDKYLELRREMLCKAAEADNIVPLPEQKQDNLVILEVPTNERNNPSLSDNEILVSNWLVKHREVAHRVYSGFRNAYEYLTDYHERNKNGKAKWTPYMLYLQKGLVKYLGGKVSRSQKEEKKVVVSTVYYIDMNYQQNSINERWRSFREYLGLRVPSLGEIQEKALYSDPAIQLQSLTRSEQEARDEDNVRRSVNRRRALARSVSANEAAIQ